MVAPLWLPRQACEEGLAPDLEAALWAVVRGAPQRRPGAAVIYDMDHTDGVYAAAEHLHDRFERVVIITPRDGIAEDMWLVARQGVLRRLRQKRIEVVRLCEPRWGGTIEHLDYEDVYNGDVGRIEGVSFFAYATPRTPRNELSIGLKAAQVPCHLVGDCRAPQDLMRATAEGHAAGEIV